MPVSLPSSSQDRLLVVAPHPDDETIATGALVQSALRAGASVHGETLTSERLFEGFWGGDARAFFYGHTFAGNPLGDDYAIVSAGFSLGAQGPLSLMVNYTGQLGGDYQIHGLTGGFSLEF